LKVKFG